MSLAPAFYFPVRQTPFRFQAGLMPFGSDFGNGAVERLYFQVDSQRDFYIAEKKRVPAARHHRLDRNDSEERAHARVLAWIRRTLAAEHPQRFAEPPASYRAIAAEVQEDLVVLHRDAEGRDAAILVDVSFPSDWRPERIVGTDFRFIHGPVPGFADAQAQARSMVTAMIERGPYVRFVWTLKTDAILDHHPDQGPYLPWQEAEEGFLRVERQLTVPFTDVGASLFLIRTYIYPFADLSPERRDLLARAVRDMPDEAARYKGIGAARPIVLSLLAN